MEQRHSVLDLDTLGLLGDRTNHDPVDSRMGILGTVKNDLTVGFQGDRVRHFLDPHKIPRGAAVSTAKVTALGVFPKLHHPSVDIMS